MAEEAPPATLAATAEPEKRYRSIFEVPTDFFDSCRLLSPSAASVSAVFSKTDNPSIEILKETADKEENSSGDAIILHRWTCNTCKCDFASLQDQRFHFKSDFHRFNVKLTIAGKHIVNEEEFDDLTPDSFKDYDVSSISGSEDEADRESCTHTDSQRKLRENFKQKLYIHLHSGKRVSVWKSLVLNNLETVSYENDNASSVDNGGCMLPFLQESEVIERLKLVINEPRDNTKLRIVLLASGGHFAGCVFNGTSVVAHKTFNRYVVRAKAGKKQSSKDASGRAAHSAGASLRRYNELALKKEIQELCATWKPYFETSTSVYIHAPSSSRQLLFNGEKPYFSHLQDAIRYVPLTVRRPTFKETKRIYNLMTQVSLEVDVNEISQGNGDEMTLNESVIVGGSQFDVKGDMSEKLNYGQTDEACSSYAISNQHLISNESESIGTSTLLHEASKSGNADEVLVLLEQGLDPSVKDGRGRTPYVLASEKEVRNTFRRFMAANLNKWDWHAAKVPSPLTEEMEESQAVKQAEKDAKKKARAKELKKLRKEKEKKAQAQAAVAQSAPKGQVQHNSRSFLSKEEEMKRAQAAEREKRAAAAERRLAKATAGLNIQGIGSTTNTPTTSQLKDGIGTGINCSCCNTSLAGKVPFHRYNYKYCSTSCMHVHREILEDA